jgi:hypothetical protein
MPDLFAPLLQRHDEEPLHAGAADQLPGVTSVTLHLNPGIFAPLLSIYVRHLAADSLHLNTGMMH